MSEESAKTRMPKIWPGALLAVTSLLGIRPAFKSLRLFLVFGLGIYLVRKLREVLPASIPSMPPMPITFKRSQQWHLAMSAGMGAFVSFILVYAIRHFFAQKATDMVTDAAAIFLVSVGMLIFLEPAFEHLRVALGIGDHHPAMQARRPLLLRLVAFGILFFAGLFHSFLEDAFRAGMASDPAKSITILLEALVVIGGITYSWVRAARRSPPRAARSGFVSGTLLGCVITYAVFAGIADLGGAKSDHSQDTPQQLAAHAALPFFPAKATDDLAAGNLSQAAGAFGGEAGLRQMGILAFLGPFFGLAGGLAIDRRWAKGKIWGVALSLFTAALLLELSLWLTGTVAEKVDMIAHLSMALGWGLALMVCSSSTILTPEPAMERASIIHGVD